MQSLVFISKIAGKFHCKKLAYNVLKHKILSPTTSKNINVEKALAVCHSIHPDIGESCIKKSSDKQSIKILYDLEIIIPVYNVEQYVEECVDSILNQSTTYSYHLIIINDGSTDNSRERLKKYEEDDRVTIIDQKNKGFSGARNTGLDNICGKYVMFVDSDDRLPQGAIEILMSKTIKGNYDIVEGGYERFDSSGIIYKQIPQQNHFSGFAWGKVYKAEVWRDIQFPEKYWFEDTISALIINSKAKQKTIVPKVIYHWRKNNKSISFTSIGNPKIIDTIYVTLKLLEDRRKLGLITNEDFLPTITTQLKINARRIYSLGNKELDYANFVISRWIFQQYQSAKPDADKDEFTKSLITSNFHCFMLASWLL